MNLLFLPNEILALIAIDLHPADLTNFTLTCRRLHGCAKQALATHRSRCQQLRVHHDRHPLAVLELLRLLIYESNLAWYFRAFEFWGSRSAWSHWKTFGPSNPAGAVWDETLEDHSNLDSSTLCDDELATYRTIIREDVSYWIRSIKNGNDGPLKAMLLAQCPRLKAVTFVQSAGDPSLNFLCDLISAYQLTTIAWPPGFWSLRSVSIGACTKAVPPDDFVETDPDQYIRLLLLPNLKRLRINQGGSSRGNDWSEIVPAHSSSLEELILYDTQFDEDDLVNLLRCVRRLRKLEEIHGSVTWHNVFPALREWFSDSLVELRIERDGLHQGGELYFVKDLAYLPELEVLDIGMKDIRLPFRLDRKHYDLHSIVPLNVRHLNVRNGTSNTLERIRTGGVIATMAEITPLRDCLEQFVRIRGKRGLRTLGVGPELPNVEGFPMKDGLPQWCESLKALCDENSVEFLTDINRPEFDEVLATEPVILQPRTS